MKYALVAVGYNRPKSMERLLNSLLLADYKGDNVPLYISIDNSGSNVVETLANEYMWPYGNKFVLTYPERQGLRNHIMGLGRLLDDYDAIAMLEDDVVVSEGFYSYMKEAVTFYAEDENVAGISLYTNIWNEFAFAPFTPMHSEFDTYFFQFAESRGQIWMKKQWKAFKTWYDNHMDTPLYAPNVPEDVSNWPNCSWKKYHICYCIATDKYFVYPYESLTTIYSEPGTNTSDTTTNIQVPILQGIKEHYYYPKLNDSKAVFYDAYYERMWKNYNRFVDSCFDLYGTKQTYGGCKYVYSTKRLHFKVINTYGMQMKPQEANVLFCVPGTEIVQYDLSMPCENSLPDNQTRIYEYRFDLAGQTCRVFMYVLCTIIMKARIKIRNFFKI